MCMTIPLEIISRKGKTAKVRNHLSQIYDVDISLLENVEKGNWILANANLGLKKIKPNEAKELLKIFKRGDNG